MLRTTLFSILVAFPLITKAQSDFPAWSYNIELGLPVPLANQPFDDIMQGLVGVSTYAQYSFPFHFHIGGGVRYSYFTVNEFAVPSPVMGGLHSGAAFAKLGWDKFHNDRFATDFGVKIGYAQNYFSTDVNREKGINPVQINSTFAELTAAVILSANERNSYRWIIGYGFRGFGFSPQNIGLESNEGYDPASFNKITQHLIVGFGYTYYFKSGGESN